jgi:hypothetical protein
MAGVVEIPDTVPLGNPVGVEVFAVAVTAESVKTGGAYPVDLTDIVPAQQIVRIKNEKGVETVKTMAAVNLFQKEIKCITLADLPGVEPAENMSAMGAGDFRGVVGAVVCNYKYLD